MEDILIDIADFVQGDSQISSEQLEAIRDLYNAIYSKSIDSSNIISYTVLLMKIIDVYKNIDNVDKKKLVVFVLTKYVELNVTNTDESQILNAFIENILPNVIDTLISLDNKQIIIKSENTVKTLCEKTRNFFGCLGTV